MRYTCRPSTPAANGSAFVHQRRRCASRESRGRGPARAIEYRITVPVGVDLELSGVHTDVSVEGTRGAISVETVQGDVRVQGGSGVISLRSVEGDVTLSGAEGRIDVSSVNEDVRVTDVSGDLTAETVNGDLVLDQVESGDVDASTVNGNVEYTGTIRDGGRYSIATHNGDITVAIPEGSNVTVSVASFSGDFESAFPVQLTETRRKRFTFVLGSGKARMELESFSGTIALERPGSRRSRNRNRHR